MQLKDLIPKEFLEQFKMTETKEPFVHQFEKYMNQYIETTLKVRSKKLQESKDQKKFLLLTLEDKTGSVRAVDWYNAEFNDNRLKEGDIIRVKGKVVFFEERIQLNVDKPVDSIKILPDGEYDPNRFVETVKKDVEYLYRKLLNFIGSIKDKEIKAILREFFVNDKEFLKKFLKAPAGMKVHHAYLGGLLEHSVSVAELCDYAWRMYRDLVNRDLLIAGALLHDVGKVYEYEVTSKGIEVTTEGELRGHITIGVALLWEKAKKIDIQDEKVLELEHMIISHHGELEWGSPIIPKTPEAFLLHHVENLDAKMSRFREISEKEKKSDSNKSWSDYDRNLGRRIFLRRLGNKGE